MAVMDPTSDLQAAHVLVVDDETVLAGMVANYLQRAGFRTSVAHDGITAVERALADAPDVVVLDLGLPGKDGLEVCHEIRRHSDCYIIMLTARNEEIDKLIGLSAGADDYMTKPFSARELVARVQVLLRRPRADRAVEEPARTVGALSIDVSGRRVTVEGTEVELTRTEFDLLQVLAARPRAAFTRASWWTRCGARTGSAMSTWSTSTSDTCGASSPRSPTWPSSRPFAASDTGWAPPDEP